MKKTLVSIGIIILFCAGLFWLSQWDAQSESTGENNTDSSVSINPITIEPEMVSVNEDSYLLGISGSYPQFSQADESFNTAIKNFVTTDIADFKRNANDNYKARLETSGEVFQEQFDSGELYNYSVNAEIIQSNSDYISVVIRYGGYSGGAHPYQNVVTFNYDIRNHKNLILSDFVSLDQASIASRVSLKKKLSGDSERTLDQSMIQMLNSGTAPSEENFRNFTFANNQITVYFGEYQVAPYVFGEQKVIIPLK